MAGTYLTWMADEFRRAGLRVVEYGGWQTRARSSGGFAGGRPLGVMWHHTASGLNTSMESLVRYECYGATARPICNVNISRTGEVWVLAAGGTNTNGAGNSIRWSRGTVPANAMNTHAFGMEINNDGVGGGYPKAQIDACFVVSNVVNRKMGNQPTDVCSHNLYAPGRKIDPAKAGSVEGWQPRSVNSSGSWNVDDLRAECQRRFSGAGPAPGPGPGPAPQPDEEDEMDGYLTRYGPDNSIWVVSPLMNTRHRVSEDVHNQLKASGKYGVLSFADPNELIEIPATSD